MKSNPSFKGWLHDVTVLHVPMFEQQFSKTTPSCRQDGDANPKLGPVAAGGGIVVLGGGEASGPLYPPVAIDETMFSCEVFWRYGTFWRNLFGHCQKDPKGLVRGLFFWNMTLSQFAWWGTRVIVIFRGLFCYPVSALPLGRFGWKNHTLSRFQSLSNITLQSWLCL